MLIKEGQSRRLKMAYITPQMIVSLLTLKANLDEKRWEYLMVPRLRNLPEGTRIVGVEYSAQHAAFAMLLEHESFDEVELGMMVPRIDVWIDTIEVHRHATAGVN